TSEGNDVEFANTADLALKVADRMGLSTAQRRNLGLAAVMHDVGKSLVPSEILSKPGSLSDHEFRVVQEHAANGAQILATDALLAPCAHIVRAHHERVDGNGYPDRLSGQSIPVEARIIAVCDSFDAITHDREYRSGLPVGLALAILRSNAGQQWDAEVVRYLMLVVADSDLAGPATDAEMEVPNDLAELLVQVDCEI
ncbi:MAG TPA: HD domain-containing phosphohydrolase, partial [Ilumatobacter sp.]|nr:HD domain-containing phosphohydrolase [Ilumatobacter sp.]